MIAGDFFEQSYSIHIYKFESLSQQMDELDFDSIVSGEQPKEQKQENKPQIKEHEKKMTKTEARERQQSCMISDIDKDLLPSSTKNNPTNFRVSLSDMLAIDKNDQSLQNYKKQLLGNIKEQQLKEDQVAEVQIFKVEVVCPGRPGGNINLDFQHTDPKQKRFFQLKEGSTYCLRVHFKVRYDIVFGLKFVNNVFKMFAKVDKDQQKMGSFAPQQKLHVFDLPWNQAPSGLLARGQYKGKGLFLDNDGIVHCQFDYVMKIDKQW